MKTWKTSVLSSILALAANIANAQESKPPVPQAEGVNEVALLFVIIDGQKIYLTEEVLHQILEYELGEEVDGPVTARVYEGTGEVVLISDRRVLVTNFGDLTSSAHNARVSEIQE